MNTDSPQVTSTNSAEECHGSVLGIETRRFGWVLLFLLLGFGAFVWLQFRRGASLSTALLILLLPAGICGLYLFFFAQGKHPSHARDLLETLHSGGDASPLPEQGSSSGKIPAGVPDGYFVGDLLVFGGLGPGGHVSQGFWVELPDLQNASDRERSALHDRLQRLTLLLPDHIGIQVRFWKDSDYRDPLLRYRKDSDAITNADVKRIRNLTFLRFWNQMQRGELRRHQVGIFLGRPVSLQTHVPWRRNEAESHYDQYLAQCETEFQEYGRVLQNLFAGIGGHVAAMTRDDHYRLYLEAFNPSFARGNRDPEGMAPDPTRTILENCWRSEISGKGESGLSLDGDLHGVLALKHWPSQTVPGIIQWLTHLPFGDYSITVQIWRVPVHQLIASLQRDLDRLNSQLAAKADERIVVTKSTLEERIQRLSHGEHAPLRVETNIIPRAPTVEALRDRKLAVKSAIHSMRGASYFDATLPATAKNLFLKTLPGWMWSNHKGVELYGETPFVADMLPLASSFTGHLDSAEALYSGTHGNLVGVKTFAGEGIHAMPQNMLVFGAPGMGKSVAINDLLLQTDPFYEYTIIVEEGQSHSNVLRTWGIEPILVKLDGSCALNVFDTVGLPMSAFQQASIVAMVGIMVHLAEDPDGRHLSALVGKAVKQLCAEYADDRLMSMSEEERRQLIRHAILIHAHSQSTGQSFAESFVDVRDAASTLIPDATREPKELSDHDIWNFQTAHPHCVRDLVFSKLKPHEHLTLSALKEFMELNASGPEGRQLARIATLLEPYCGEGSYGAIFDRPSNVSLTGRGATFELGLIPQSANELKQAFGCLILNNGRQHFMTLPRLARKRIVIEELSRFLDGGGDKIVRELFEQMRKYRVQVTAILQQYSRITDPSLRAALIGCTPAYFIFNPGDRTDLALLAKDIGLSEAACERILRYPRPSQLKGQIYSEFTYLHGDSHHPVCGTIRHFHIGTESQSTPR